MRRHTFPRWLTVALGAATVILLVGGAGFYREQERSQRKRAEAQLLVIAQLKADQIVRWRDEHLADAAVLTESMSFVDRAADWLASPSAVQTQAIRAHFHSWQLHYHYQDVLLVDAAGQVRLSLGGASEPLGPEALQPLAEAGRSQRPVLTDLHAGPGDRKPHLDVIAPIYAPEDGGSKFVGAVVLQADARQFLYPLIQAWPTSSASAESLLVRRDGDDVLFLNDLRHRQGTALQLRIPLTRTDVPAVQAVLGREGVLLGHDYRGVDVFSVLKPVPDSPWFLIAKVDTAEVLAGWRVVSVLILALLMLLVVGAIGTVLLVWQQNERQHFRELAQAEAALRASEERHRATLMSVGDAVIATDAEGRVELLNTVAEALTGWRQAEAEGRPLAEVFQIINEDTRQAVDNPALRVLRDGVIVNLANHTLLIAKDGTERPIADAGAPIRDADGQITGVVLVFRDQTAERAAREALNASEVRYRRLFEAAKDGILILAADTGVVVDVNPFLADLLGASREEVLGRTLWELGFFKDVVANRAKFAELCQREYARYEDLPLETADGRRLDVEFVSNLYQVDHQPVIQCNIRDITERKRTQLEREAMIELLRLINASDDTRSLMRAVTAFVQQMVGCHAVGVRLHEGEDFPYFETRGFADEFVQAENRLCTTDPQGELVRDEVGNPALECMCGNILCGRVDPSKSFFTEHGSFWSNNTTALLASTTEADRQARTRNRCNGEGYESVALLPLRADGQTFGLLQCNDRRSGRFTAEQIAMLERFADQLAIGLAHRQAAAALRESEQRYRQLFDEMRTGFALHEIICDASGIPVDYRFLAVNPAFEHLTGLRATEIVGRTTREVLPDLEPMWVERYGRVALTGEPADFEAYNVSLDKTFEVRAFAPKQGQFATLFVDVSQRKRQERALREAHLRQEAAVRAGNVGLWDWDLKTNKVHYSPEWKSQIGYADDEIGDGLEEWQRRVHPDDLERSLAAVRTAIENPRPDWEIEFRFRHKDGSYRWILACAGVEVDEQGAPCRMRGSHIDITARKQAEEALRASEEQLRQAQKMEAVGQLAAGIAHDFNNLLTALYGYLSLADDARPHNSAVQEALSGIETVAQHATGLTRGLLTFSGRTASQKDDTDLGSVIRDVARLLRRTLPAAIDLVVEADVTPPIWVHADPTQLQQVLMNLAVNARDAMPDGGRLRVTLTGVNADSPGAGERAGDARGRQACIEVTDTGEGMTAEVLAHIFEPFFTTKARGRGTGLGLAVIRGIVQDHGGRITVESEPGRGATFRVYLPCVPRAQDAVREARADDAERGSGEVILLAEDDQHVREIIATSLQQHGYQVVSAADGQELLDQYREHRSALQLLVLDVDLPRRSGLDCLAAIRAAGDVVPSLVITAHAELPPGSLGERDRLLPKPFRLGELAQAVAQILHPSRSKESVC